MLLPNRHGSSTAYRYGFNGKEKDDEVRGSGLQYDYGFRIYDPRIGKFLSTDPLFKGYPYYTPYQFAGNRPIWAVDLDGLEELTTTKKARVLTITRIYNSQNELIKGYVKIYNESNETFMTVTTQTKVIQEGDKGGKLLNNITEYRRVPRSTPMPKEGVSIPHYEERNYRDFLGVVDPNNHNKPMTNDQEDNNKPQQENHIPNNGRPQNTNLQYTGGGIDTRKRYLVNNETNNTIINEIVANMKEGNYNLTISMTVPDLVNPLTTPYHAGKNKSYGTKLKSENALGFLNSFTNLLFNIKARLVKEGLDPNSINLTKNKGKEVSPISIQYKPKDEITN